MSAALMKSSPPSQEDVDSRARRGNAWRRSRAVIVP